MFPDNMGESTLFLSSLESIFSIGLFSLKLNSDSTRRAIEILNSLNPILRNEARINFKCWIGSSDAFIIPQIPLQDQFVSLQTVGINNGIDKVFEIASQCFKNLTHLSFQISKVDLNDLTKWKHLKVLSIPGL